MGKITLCGVSASEYTVKCGSSEAELHAGEVMRTWIEKICGEKMMGGRGVIDLRIDPALPDTEGYRIRNAEGALEIIGGNARGILYGVYGFLEKYLGVRSFAPDVERYNSDAEIPELDETFEPIFEYRQSGWFSRDDIDWRVANRINTHDNPDPKYGGFMKWGGFVHTMHAITGVPRTEQPCLTDPAMLEKAITYTRELLQKDPSVKLVSVSQNDNFKYCTCPRCAAIDEEEGSHMGTLLRFVNAVAENMKDDYPKVAIETLAYQYTRRAPKITRPLPNVVIRLCSIECCFSHPLSDATCDRNKAFVRDIEEWNRICQRLYIWDYVTNFAYYIPTFPNFGVLRENMRFFALHGVKGMYPEGNYQTVSGEFAELRSYLLAKLMWDPLMSEEEYQGHVDAFLEAYYGAGWRNIRAYIDLMTGLAKRNHIGIYDPPFVMIPKELYEAVYSAAEGWWDAAEAAAGDRLEAVQRSRLQWTYLSLTVKPKEEKARAFYRDVNARGIRWRENQNDWPEEQDFQKPPTEWAYRKLGDKIIYG
ncbi:MAG: DUF4838 domain-containing protein [Clostridia bacterium]|nr:DUF4838 domain-containing protein [Clostridia bacterium]